MPSRAETRGRIEMALRVVSVGIIAFMLWQSLDHGRADSVVSGRTADLRAGLRDWSRSGIAPNRISIELDSVPSPRDRDWLAALRASGSRVSWNGSLPAVGLDVQPVASPAGGYRMLVSAPAGSSVVIGDEIGPIDTVRAGNGGASVNVPSASGVVTATTGGSTSRATLPDTLKIRRLLVIGDADWESKFVIAALEEGRMESRRANAPRSRCQRNSGLDHSHRHFPLLCSDCSRSLGECVRIGHRKICEHGRRRDHRSCCRRG
jgi:hypothetical protein